MRRAEHHIMSQTADTEPPRWPIAPDGYIPNSVIRSWKRKGKGFAKMDSCNDNFSALLYMDEASDEDEDMNSRIFWLTDDDEEEEKEETEKEDEKKNKKQKVEKTEVGVKAREDEKKEKKQDKMDRSVSRPIAIHENEHQPLRELREDVKLPETITPPQKYVSVTNKQTPFTSLIKKRRMTRWIEVSLQSSPTTPVVLQWKDLRYLPILSSQNKNSGHLCTYHLQSPQT
ncbi:uncharacterized protein LOC104926454 isoform X2 [Larimichthys crocea]|uniref:Uncharacterized protein n=1 Tax=Larimichthys crocea TaxID=215358 RepID=A0ACD3QKW7_LARCR|nr:uncharacterized protein LOC104926454 isoform X2 [Larimichthys crocea]TMS07697.1 hypothetical protein E3U43_011790 [Larimichthys crocea]